MICRDPLLSTVYPPAAARFGQMVDQSGVVDLIEGWMESDLAEAISELAAAQESLARAQTSVRKATSKRQRTRLDKEVQDLSSEVQVLRARVTRLRIGVADLRQGGSRDTIRWTVKSVLVAMFLLLNGSRRISVVNILDVLVREMGVEACGSAGIDYPGGRAAAIRAGDAPDASASDIAAADRAFDLEYDRLHKGMDAFFETIDPSPHSRRKREKNKVLMLEEKALHPEERDRLAVRRSRLDTVLNDLLVASIDRDLLAGWGGDVVIDEFPLVVADVRSDTGTKPHRRHCGDPDAGYGIKRHTKKHYWGYGVHPLIVAPNPARHSDAGVPRVALAIYIGKPSTGPLKAVITLLEHATRRGLLPKAKRGSKMRFIVDRGYSALDGLFAVIWRYGFLPVVDYAKTTGRRKTLMDAGPADGDDRSEKQVPGPVLWNGILMCPGFRKVLPEIGRLPKDVLELSKDPDEMAERLTIMAAHEQEHRRVAPGIMPVTQRPREKRAERPGRPRRDAQPTGKHVIEVMCPAVAGQVLCTLYKPLPPGEPVPDLPDVPDPPSVALAPRCCLQRTAKYDLDDGTHLKILQDLPYGSLAWEGVYGPARSLNEQWNSVATSWDGANLTGHNTPMRGIARVGVVAAIGLALCNIRLQRPGLLQRDGREQESVRRRIHRVLEGLDRAA